MSAPLQIDCLRPDWPVPANIQAIATTRTGGVSVGTYAGLNLATHVGDAPKAVQRNRQQLITSCDLPAAPYWLEQVHGCAGVQAGQTDSLQTADWSWSDVPGVVCAVLTADCLPVLLADRAGRQVAAVHAGWRGLCAGVLEAAVAQFVAAGIPSAELLAWFGPAIGASAYEIDAPVRNAVLARSPNCASAFAESRPGHWRLDMVAAARALLHGAGVSACYGGHYCTFDNTQFYSHRREAPCGRQATLIWLT